MMVGRASGAAGVLDAVLPGSRVSAPPPPPPAPWSGGHAAAGVLPRYGLLDPCRVVVIITLKRLLIFASSMMSSTFTLSDLPYISSKNVVQFYYCQRSVAPNSPTGNPLNAESLLSQYKLFAGLGIWDVVSNRKYTVELIPHNYLSFVGGLLPTLTKRSGLDWIEWNNTASIVVTSPIDDDGWNNAVHLSTATGAAYSDLVSYLKSRGGDFEMYQPVTYFSSSSPSLNNIGIYAHDSYNFLFAMISSLAEAGCVLNTYLPLSFYVIGYVGSAKSKAAVISWNVDGSVNADVYRWYADLSICLGNTISSASPSVKSLQKCYGQYAYIYASPTSVYNMSLDVTSASPQFLKMRYNLPPVYPKNVNRLSDLDIAVLAVSLIILSFCLAGCVWQLVVKKTSKWFLFLSTSRSIGVVSSKGGNGVLTSLPSPSIIAAASAATDNAAASALVDDIAARRLGYSRQTSAGHRAAEKISFYRTQSQDERLPPSPDKSPPPPHSRGEYNDSVSRTAGASPGQRAGGLSAVALRIFSGGKANPLSPPSSPSHSRFHISSSGSIGVGADAVKTVLRKDSMGTVVYNSSSRRSGAGPSSTNFASTPGLQVDDEEDEEWRWRMTGRRGHDEFDGGVAEIGTDSEVANADDIEVGVNEKDGWRSYDDVAPAAISVVPVASQSEPEAETAVDVEDSSSTTASKKNDVISPLQLSTS